MADAFCFVDPRNNAMYEREQMKQHLRKSEKRRKWEKEK